MTTHRLVELIRQHGSESDLPEFNKKRKPSKEEYVYIILKLLTDQWDEDLGRVSKYLEVMTVAVMMMMMAMVIMVVIMMMMLTMMMIAMMITTYRNRQSKNLAMKMLRGSYLLTNCLTSCFSCSIIQEEAMAPVKKGFGAPGAGFGSKNKSPKIGKLL